MSDLGFFQGKPVVASKVIVKKAGDGLTKPLAAEPRAFMSGERVPMLLWGTWGSIGFDPTKEGHGFVQVHDFDTEEAAVLDHVDPAMLDGLLASQREKVADYEREQARLKAEAKGISELPLDDAVAAIKSLGDKPDPWDDGDGEGDLPVGDWQADAAVAAPTPIGGRKGRGKG